MDSTLRDDVKALMDKGFGDDRILRQILRACDNDEVISNFERGYVHKLAELHLDHKLPIRKLQISTAPQKPVDQTSQALVRPTPKIVHRKSNKKFYYIIAIIGILSISAGAAYILSNSSTPIPPIPPAPPLPDLPIYITTDLRSYSIDDIISISGRSTSNTDTAMLSIKSPSETIVWTETVAIKDTEFATLVIATGEWSEMGQYVLLVDDYTRSTSTTFTYR